jgi:hypothetical protein
LAAASAPGDFETGFSAGSAGFAHSCDLEYVRGFAEGLLSFYHAEKAKLVPTLGPLSRSVDLKGTKRTRQSARTRSLLPKLAPAPTVAAPQTSDPLDVEDTLESEYTSQLGPLSKLVVLPPEPKRVRKSRLYPDPGPEDFDPVDLAYQVALAQPTRAPIRPEELPPIDRTSPSRKVVQIWTWRYSSTTPMADIRYVMKSSFHMKHY